MKTTSDVKATIQMAKAAHDGRPGRTASRPHIVHPMQVMETVREFFPDDEALQAAAVLHDTIEDTDVTREIIAQEFGEDVATLVDEVTNRYSKEAQPTLNRAERKLLEHRRLSAVSLRAKALKTADRLRNLEESDSLTKEFLTLYIEESQDLMVALWGPGDAHTEPEELRVSPDRMNIVRLIRQLIKAGKAAAVKLEAMG